MRKFQKEFEKILIEMDCDEKKALEDIKSLKKELKKVSEGGEEINSVCAYNALATINSVPFGDKVSRQLKEAILEAKEEIRVICDSFE